MFINTLSFSGYIIAIISRIRNEIKKYSSLFYRLQYPKNGEYNIKQFLKSLSLSPKGLLFYEARSLRDGSFDPTLRISPRKVENPNFSQRRCVSSSFMYICKRASLWKDFFPHCRGFFGEPHRSRRGTARWEENERAL